MRRAVTVTTLDYFGPKETEDTPDRPYDLREVAVACPELNRFLYASVGAAWCWYSRLPWTYQQWLDYLEDPAVTTWIGYDKGNPVGYFELRRETEALSSAQRAPTLTPKEQPAGRRAGAILPRQGAVEIAYFGLLPHYIGRGLGKRLLGDAIARASTFGDGRIWLHTCSLDHPAALPNYLARGFRVRQTEVVEEELPDAPLEPWPGARGS